jgi:isocitrate/isopropylmalate dehydrogenase
VDVLGFEIVCSKCQAPLRLIAGERYKRTGEILPDSALEEFKNFDSIFPRQAARVLRRDRHREFVRRHHHRPGGIIQGGLGIAAGGNINPEGVSMFEPMGGSAPKYTGKNFINPLATICAGGMMLDTLGGPKIAQAIYKAVHDALASKQIRSLAAGKMGMGTREVGDLIATLVS